MIDLPHFSPVAIEFFGFAIRWYALAYIAGFTLALWQVRKMTIQAGYGWDKKFWDDLLTYSVFGVILGGRLGYVLFYDLGHFISAPSDIIKVWQGGMSFHGGMLGLAAANYVYTLKMKVPFFKVQDMLAVVAPIGLFLGRCANFINQELMGAPTDSIFGVRFGGQGVYQHPTPLYEAALEGLVLFVIMKMLFAKDEIRKRTGILTGVFLTGYGLFRFLVEFVRLPDAHIGYLMGGWLTMGHILSFPMILGGLGLVLYAWKKSKQKI
ncbi:MAG: prolipoprotein diacylglyceryl transferase [Alphaproteobacteria bacterium]|nr:prolipoprotein diacylglyceryl transferase [Alphaproteobacteria bacterium]